MSQAAKLSPKGHCGFAGLADIYRAEFAQTAAHAGITCIPRMSAKATGAMWTNAILTKWKSRKISAYQLD
jgi:hypothetical protein